MIGDMARKIRISFIQQTGIMTNLGVAVIVAPAELSHFRVSHVILGLNTAAVAALQ